MTKLEFLEQLRKGLSGLPQDDIEERINFYSEMIDDRIEDGLSEETAVEKIGSVDEIVLQTISEIPLAKLVNEKIKQNRALKIWELILIILGFPLWFPLLCVVLSLMLSVYVVLWSLLISLWAVEVSIWGSVVGGIVSSIVFMVCGNSLTGVAMIGTCVFCLGLSVFLFLGCTAATKGTVLLTKKIALSIKNCFIKKEAAQ